MEEGRGYSLKRHSRFYDPDVPRLATLERGLFQDLDAHQEALRRREIDYWLSADARVTRALMDDLPGIALNEHGSLEFNSFWMRVDTEPWNDERVRRAVNRSLDRAEYIDLIGGGAGDPMGPLAPAFGEYALDPEELAQLQPFDPDEARALFSAAGVTGFSFVYPVSGDTNEYVTILARQLAAVGVEVTPVPLDPTTWLDGYIRSMHTASLSLNQSYKTPDAALLWHRSGGPTGSGQYATGYGTAELDRLIDAAATTLDEPERIEVYQEAQRTVLESDPAFLNIFNLRQHALHFEDIHGLDPGPGHMGEFLYRQVWVEERAAAG
jgi:peptide/nickel transport system substrate-binding protein